MASEVVEVEGHIIDSLILAKVMDTIIAAGADYRMLDVRIGKTNTDTSCKIATYVLGPAVQPGARELAFVTHYSMLRTTENMLGLKPYLGAAASATSMRKPLGL